MGQLLPTEKQKLAAQPKPSFHIRPAVPSDASALFNLEEHFIQHSIRATADNPGPLSSLESLLPKLPIPNSIILVAIPTIEGVSKPHRWYHRDKPAAESAVNYTVENVDTLVANYKAAKKAGKAAKDSVPTFPGILGEAWLCPFIETAPTRTVGRSCYDRTATLALTIVVESLLGHELWHAVHVALIDEVFSRVGEYAPRYKTVTTTTTFSEKDHTLVKYRDILLEGGFEQVGRYREVVEKNGFLLDRISLQRGVDIAKPVEDSEVKE